MQSDGWFWPPDEMTVATLPKKPGVSQRFQDDLAGWRLKSGQLRDVAGRQATTRCIQVQPAQKVDGGSDWHAVLLNLRAPVSKIIAERIY